MIILSVVRACAYLTMSGGCVYVCVCWCCCCCCCSDVLEGASPRAKSPSFGDIAFFRFLVRGPIFLAGFAKHVTSVISTRFFETSVRG